MRARGADGQHATRDSLEVAGGLARGAVDQEWLVSAHGEPHRVVVLNVAQLLQRQTQVALREGAHPGAELEIRADPRLVHDQAHAHAMGLGPGELGELRVHLLERADQLERRRERADLGDGALHHAEAEAIAEQRATQAATEGGAEEAVSGLDRRRLGDGDADGHIGVEHQIEREMAVTGTDVDDEELGRERAHARQPPRFSPRAEGKGRENGVVRGRQEGQPRHRRGDEAALELGLRRGLEGGIAAGRGEAEAGVEVRAGGVRVDEDDGLAELREVDREVLREQRFPHAAATATDHDEPARSLERLGRLRVGRLTRGRGKRGGIRRRAHARGGR